MRRSLTRGRSGEMGRASSEEAESIRVWSFLLDEGQMSV